MTKTVSLAGALVALLSGCVGEPEAVEPEAVEPESEILAAFGISNVELGMRLHEVEERRPTMEVGGYGAYLEPTVEGIRVVYSFSPARSYTEGDPSPPNSKLIGVTIHSVDNSREDWEGLYRRIEVVKGPGVCAEGRFLGGRLYGVGKEFRAEWPGVALEAATLTTGTEEGPLTPVTGVFVRIGFEPVEGVPAECSEAAEGFPWLDQKSAPDSSGNGP